MYNMGMSYFIDKRIGPIIIIVSTFLPLLFFALGNGFEETNFFRLIGKIFALIGTMLLCLNFIISTRTKLIDRLFWGMNRAYIIHHIIGAVSLTLLLFHPLSLVIPYLSFSARSALNFLIPIPPSSNLSNWYGLLALLIMLLLLFLTFFASLSYQLWLTTHKLLGIPLVFALLHVLLTESDTTSNLTLRYYLLIWIWLAIFAYCYRTLFGKYLIHKTKYSIAEIDRLGDVIYLVMTPLKSPLIFKPGQFIFLKIISPSHKQEVHPFSITSAPEGPTLTVAAKMLGDYTATLPTIELDSIVEVEGPYGTFGEIRGNQSNQIWVAGGIGIAPFLSMLKSLPKNSSQIIHLFYCVKNETEAAFSQDLISYAKQIPNFHPHLALSAKSGRLTAKTISLLTPDIKSNEIFVCGPPPMMTSLRRQFIELGIKDDLIHTEEFSLE